MTNAHSPSLEKALIRIVETELSNMRSFCEPHFPCDLSTTVAMRMSRSTIAAICSVSSAAHADEQIVSCETGIFLQSAKRQLVQLSDTFEKRLTSLPDVELAWKAWTV